MGGGNAWHFGAISFCNICALIRFARCTKRSYKILWPFLREEILIIYVIFWNIVQYACEIAARWITFVVVSLVGYSWEDVILIDAMAINFYNCFFLWKYVINAASLTETNIFIFLGLFCPSKNNFVCIKVSWIDWRPVAVVQWGNVQSKESNVVKFSPLAF